MGGDLVLHLHRLDDDEQGALVDLVALGDLDLEDAALQRRDHVVAGCRRRAGLALALRRPLAGCRDGAVAAERRPDDLDRIEPPAEGDDEADTTEREYKVEVGGRLYPVKVIGAALGGNGAVPAAGRRPPKRERKAGSAAASGNDVVAPLQGSIFKVEVAEGDEVAEGALLVVIEAMKMENEVTAHKAGKVTSLAVEVGASINAGDAIATIE